MDDFFFSGGVMIYFDRIEVVNVLSIGQGKWSYSWGQHL